MAATLEDRSNWHVEMEALEALAFQRREAADLGGVDHVVQPEIPASLVGVGAALGGTDGIGELGPGDAREGEGGRMRPGGQRMAGVAGLRVAPIRGMRQLRRVLSVAP